MKEIGQNERMSFTPAPKHFFDRANRISFHLLVGLILFTAPLSAQNNDREIKITTDLSTFEVTVSDATGKPVRNLAPGDLQLFENGVERPIEFFQPIRKKDRTRPLVIVFALDVSGSMTESELGLLRSAMTKFVDRLADYESVFAIMTFAMNVKTNQNFTNRPAKLAEAFEDLRRDQDGLSTHAYDAVDDAIRQIARKAPKRLGNQFPRRAVILITDGFPVGDVVSPATVIERANKAETSVFSVLLPSYSRLQASRRILTPLEASGLTEKTGGLSITVSDSNFDKIFAALAEQITSSYAVAYYPDRESQAGKPVQVKIVSRSGLVIRQNRDRAFPN